MVAVVNNHLAKGLSQGLHAIAENRVIGSVKHLLSQRDGVNLIPSTYAKSTSENSAQKRTPQRCAPIRRLHGRGVLIRLGDPFGEKYPLTI